MDNTKSFLFTTMDDRALVLVEAMAEYNKFLNDTGTALSDLPISRAAQQTLL